MRRFYHGQNSFSLATHLFSIRKKSVKTVFYIIIIGCSEADIVSASVINFYDERNSGNNSVQSSGTENVLIQRWIEILLDF